MMLEKDKKLISKALLYHTIFGHDDKVDQIFNMLTVDEIKEIIDYMLSELEKKKNF